jgi:hypothetical protein
MIEQIPGDGMPRFRVFRADANGSSLGSAVYESDSVEAIGAFRRRGDWRYVYRIDGEWMNEGEFRNWKKAALERGL